VYDVLVEGVPVRDAVVPTSTPGLSVLPSDEDLAGAELDLASVIGREVLLRDALEPLRSDRGDAPYDYVFLDCPPSLGLLSLNALAAADEVFIALQTEFFAMRGLGALDRTIDLVRKRINPRLEIGGIVPTLVDLTRLSRDVMDEVRRHYGDKVFATRVRSSVRLAEAPSFQKHVFDYAPDSPGAHDYAALALEMEEGRAAVESAAATAAVAAPTPAGAPPAPPKAPALRGIARAIAEAAAAVTQGEGPVPAPRAAAAPGRAAEPAREAPRPARSDGPRPVFLPPIPTRAPAALPRAKPAVAAAPASPAK
jgi:chromosome partitioning protein